MSKFLQTAFYASLLIIGLSLPFKGLAQTVPITASPGQSIGIVVGNLNYHVSESIYTDAEIGNTAFTTAADAINHIDFNVSVVGSQTDVSNYNIYFKEVPLSSTVFSNNTSTYSTADYTLVFSGTYNAANVGWAGVDLTTTFTRTSGTNLQILIERFDNLTHSAFSFNAARGNSTDLTLTTSRRINTNTLPVSGTTVLNSLTNFRPQIRLRHIHANDIAVAQIYTLGKLPIPFATPHVISANIVNNGNATQTNLNVTLTISGANTFSNSQIISSLAPGETTDVTFTAFTPVSSGINTVSVAIPADDFPGDDVMNIQQEISLNAYNYAYGTVPTGSAGFNITGPNPTGTGDIVAKFTTSSPTSVNQVGVNFAGSGQPFRIGIWDKSGNGVPGTLLWESAEQTTTVGVFTLPINPPVAVTDTFYVGVRQISSTNMQFAYQTEIPIRPNTFFLATPIGNTAWSDFAPGNPYKFMIEPRLTIANDVGITAINNPGSNSVTDNCGITPQATVANFGSSDQSTPFGVTFQINQNGVPVYSNTQQVTLNSGESRTIDFPHLNGSISGDDSSFVYTSLASDGARNNDTVVNKFTTNNSSYGLATVASGGYEFANSTECALPSGMQQTYNWITETSNELNWAGNGDDSVLATPITLPFNFYFMGISYNQFWINSNGWISFTDPTALSGMQQRTPVTIPLAGGIENYIAGVLTDLDVTSVTYPDAHTYHGGNANRYVITFEHAHAFDSETNFITFQIVLNAADSSVVIQYNDAQTAFPVPSAITNFCSVGIENAGGTAGIQYRLNASGGPVFGSPLAVKFRPVAVTPVTLVNFAVQRTGRTNKVSWTTSQEINSRDFSIERSINGIDYTSIGVVIANGNSNRVINYSFTDQSPAKGINYYRLKSTDVDAHSKYSAVRSVRNEALNDMSIYPNPVKEKLTIVINTEKAGHGNVSITEVSGKQVYQQSIVLTDGYNKVPVDTERFSPGVYLLKVMLSGETILRKFNKL